MVISKTIQYMVSVENKNPFRLSYKSSYDENEQVLFDAGVFNDAGETIQDADVSIVLSGENDNEFKFTFSNNNGVYTLNAGFLPPGIYSFRATAKIGGKSLLSNGRIVVTALQSELTDLVADYSLLRSLSNKTGGLFFNFSNSADLEKSILNQKNIKPVIYSRKSLAEAISLKWIFFLLACLLSTEWFLRKRSGGY
ncbi:MAG: carboxypeptidase-like regulatory domain-containing protein [Bacteroidota bacterium]